MGSQASGLFSMTPLAPLQVLVNLLLCVLLAGVLAWHFGRFGTTFTNRAHFGKVLLTVALTTVLVISIIKSSLALSLGLVGALSIVRFRTPLKEPEELAYLFLAIAIGLGLGAGQQLVTIAATMLILLVLSLWALARRRSNSSNLFLNVEVPSADHADEVLSKLLKALGEHVSQPNMRRFDVSDGSLQASFYINCTDGEQLVGLQEDLRKRFPGSSLTFVDQSAMPEA